MGYGCGGSSIAEYQDPPVPEPPGLSQSEQGSGAVGVAGVEACLTGQQRVGGSTEPCEVIGTVGYPCRPLLVGQGHCQSTEFQIL